MAATDQYADGIVVKYATTLLGRMPKSGRLDSEGVHQVRRTSKRIRAVLRLIEDTGRPGTEQVRRSLTRATRQLSGLRDAAVVARTAAALESKLKGKKREGARILSQAPAPEPTDAWWNAVWRSFALVQRETGAMDQSALSPKTLAKALRRSVRRMGKRAKQVRHDADAERAHEWRKAVLLLRHQLAAVYPRGEAETGELQVRLKKLGQTLGTAADCEQLCNAIDHRSWPESLQKAAARLAADIEKKRNRAIRRACRQWSKVKRALPANIE